MLLSLKDHMPKYSLAPNTHLSHEAQTLERGTFLTLRNVFKMKLRKIILMVFRENMFHIKGKDSLNLVHHHYVG